MAEWLTSFIGGLLGSAHCIGMCGGFAIIVGSGGQPMCKAASRQLTYNFGRVFTYTFLGAIGGFAGQYLAQFDGALVSIQQIFSITAGVIMILVGTATLGAFSMQRFFSMGVTTKLASGFSALLRLPGRRGLFLGGVANGFLPCGLVYAFLAMAIATGSMLKGLLTMLFFGIGTIPAMTLIGCGSSFVTHRIRAQVLRLAAVLVIITGGICIRRGWIEKGSCCETHAATIPELKSKARIGLLTIVIF